MNWRVIVWGAALTVLTAALPVAAEVPPGDLPAAEFLRLAAYRSTMQDSFARLTGKVSHLRRNTGGAEYYRIDFRILFYPGRMDGEVLLDGRELYRISRRVGTGIAVTSAGLPAPPREPLLKHLGIEVGDLAMGFLDLPFRSEEPRERVKTVECRVLRLARPDGGSVKVWISREHLFPIRAQFFSPGARESEKPVRTLEITGFREINGYYVVTDLAVLGREYRTRIEFDVRKVGRNTAAEAKEVFAPEAAQAQGK